MTLTCGPLDGHIPYGEQRPLLDYTLGEGNYTVRTVDIPELARDDDKRAAVETIIAQDETLSLATATDSKVYLLWAHDHPGWLAFTKAAGITVENSAKLAKRVTTLTRQVGAHAIGEFSRTTMSATQWLHPEDAMRINAWGEQWFEVALDGGNVISRELVEAMIAHLPRAQRRAILKAGSYQFRALLPEGLVKGDALMSSREQMGGHDLLYHPASRCAELASETPYVLIEPRRVVRRAVHECLDVGDPPALAPAWTDDQTMAWLGPWAWPHEHLQSSLRDVVWATLNTLRQGNLPHYARTRTPSLDDAGLYHSIVDRAKVFDRDGLGVHTSVHLTEALGRGLMEHLERRPRWPISHAGHPAVATDAWLRVAGYDESHWPDEADRSLPQRPRTLPGQVWLHEPTGRLVYNDADFVALYPRHGGWDLDDTVTAMWRKIDEQIKVITYRQPNTYGEYAIASHPKGAFTPEWVQHFPDGTSVRAPMPELASEQAPEYLENIPYQVGDQTAFEVDKSPRGNGYERTHAITALNDSLRAFGVLGRWVNVEMAWHATHHTPRTVRVAATEQVVDACTQHPSASAIEAIIDDADAARSHLDRSSNVIDPVIWAERIAPNGSRPRYASLRPTWWSSRLADRSAALLAARNDLAEIAQKARDNVPSEIIRLGLAFHREGSQLVRAWHERVVNAEGDDRSRFAIADEWLSHTISERAHDEAFEHDLVLAIARNVYTTPRRRGWSDTLLFGDLMLDRYIAALQFYRLDEPETIEWSYFCIACGRAGTTNDRVAYQQVRLASVWGCSCDTKVAP